MQGDRLEESNWIPQHLFYCDSYIVMYDVIYNLLLIMCVWTILSLLYGMLNTIRNTGYGKGDFSKCILKMNYLIDGFYIEKEKDFYKRNIYKIKG